MCYTMNISSFFKRHKKTPYEVMKKRQPNISYFRVFGSPCFELIDSEQLGKFDAKVGDEIFLGFAQQKKVFGVFNFRKQITIKIISCHI